MISKLVVSEFVASQSPLSIKEAVEELLHEYFDEHGGDKRLCQMIVDKTLQMRMCESPLTSSGELHTS